jgi:cytochrome b involved in lipid metabolism
MAWWACVETMTPQAQTRTPQKPRQKRERYQVQKHTKPKLRQQITMTMLPANAPRLSARAAHEFRQSDDLMKYTSFGSDVDTMSCVSRDDGLADVPALASPLHAPSICCSPLISRPQQVWRRPSTSSKSGGHAVDVTRVYYTMDEVRRHNSMESAWVVAGDAVYDVTTYLSQHPGGMQSLLKRAGGVRDCTEDFLFHGKSARKLWAKYRIGTLQRSPSSSDSSSKPWWSFWSHQ